MPSNTAAWIEEPKGRPLVVREAPYKSPGKGQVLIRNAAVAINPVDYKMQATDLFKLTYPAIFGVDVAGEVVEVGEDVTFFKPGQHVFAHSAGLLSKEVTQCGFQQYTITPANLTSTFPDTMKASNAVVLGLGVATAAAGLYQKEFLALDLPSVSTKPGSAGKVAIVWGGSSSVGSCAIQLLVNSGYEVFATASKRNLAYVKELGATEAFDYSNSNVVNDIVKALKGKQTAGFYDAIGSEETTKGLVQIASESEGTKFIASVARGTEKLSTSDVTIKPVFATTITNNEVGAAVFNDFLPQALADGKFLAKPDPVIVGHGLDKVQEGMDKLKAGVSAAKLVVTL